MKIVLHSSAGLRRVGSVETIDGLRPEEPLVYECADTFFDRPSWAIFSQDLKFRYALGRTWDPKKKPAVFIGLNPSTADALKNDPTVAKEIRMAKSWGCGGLIKANLFGWRSTDPKGLLDTPDPVGVGNDCVIRALIPHELVVCAWGTQAGAVGKLIGPRERAVLTILADRPLQCLALTKEGRPRHPLYLKDSSVPVSFR